MSDEEKTGDTMSADLVRYAPAPVAEYRPQIMLAPEEAKALDDALRANMLAVLRPDVDYGVIPGTKKPSLLKPGAEKLLQWFGYGHTMIRDDIERDADGNRVGVTYKCTVTKALADGRMAVVAACDGYAGYDEDRFYISAADAEAKERANAAKYKRDPWPAKFAEFKAPVELGHQDEREKGDGRCGARGHRRVGAVHAGHGRHGRCCCPGHAPGGRGDCRDQGPHAWRAAASSGPGTASSGGRSRGSGRRSSGARR